MLKLSAVVDTQKKVKDQYVEQSFIHHTYIGIFLFSVVMPILIMMAVSVICFVVTLPISIFMGWL